MRIPAIPSITTVGNMIRIRCEVSAIISGVLNSGPGATTSDHLGREDHPQDRDHTENCGGERCHREGHLPGFAAAFLLQEPREDGDEGRGQGRVGQKGADQIGDLVGYGEGPHLGAQAKIGHHDDLPDQTKDPGAGGRQHQEGRGQRKSSLRLVAHVRGLC